MGTSSQKTSNRESASPACRRILPAPARRTKPPTAARRARERPCTACAAFQNSAGAPPSKQSSTGPAVKAQRALRRPDDAVECLPRDAEIASVEADDVQAAVRTRYAHCRCGRRRAETPAAVRAAARGPFRRSHGICAAQTVLIDRLLCTAFSSRPAPFKGW